jgi:hypothetical protein
MGQLLKGRLPPRRVHRHSKGEGAVSRGLRKQPEVKTPAVERRLDMDEDGEADAWSLRYGASRAQAAGGTYDGEHESLDHTHDPRRDQVQFASHPSVLNMVAEARLIIASSGAKYPAISMALLDRCGGP